MECTLECSFLYCLKWMRWYYIKLYDKQMKLKTVVLEKEIYIFPFIYFLYESDASQF